MNWNTAQADGGGLYCSNSEIVIRDNIIKRNTAVEGGGVRFSGGDPRVENNIIRNNWADRGAGIHSDTYAAFFENNTIVSNEAALEGGGLWGTATFQSCILWENVPDQIAGPAMVTYSDVQGGYFGLGNINSDPLFASVPQVGHHFLSQVAAGQLQDSPCVDAGDPHPFDWRKHFEKGAAWGTTRTDRVNDAGRIDMGYHYATQSQEVKIPPGQSLQEAGP